jgi:ribonuclease Z
MGAHRTILTHFSQRYPKAVEFESNLPAADSTCIAFDGMVVPFSELGRLPSLLQPIRLALADVERAEGEEGG